MCDLTSPSNSNSNSQVKCLNPCGPHVVCKSPRPKQLQVDYLLEFAEWLMTQAEAMTPPAALAQPSHPAGLGAGRAPLVEGCPPAGLAEELLLEAVGILMEDDAPAGAFHVWFLPNRKQVLRAGRLGAGARRQVLGGARVLGATSARGFKAVKGREPSVFYDDHSAGSMSSPPTCLLLHRSRGRRCDWQLRCAPAGPKSTWQAVPMQGAP
jgi:hypothetical protein